MNTLSFYNFAQYLTDEQIYRDWFDQYKSLTTRAEREKFERVKPKQPEPRVSKADLLDLDLLIAKYSPVKIGEKYSVSDTLAKIDDNELKNYLKWVGLTHNRSKLYSGSAKHNTRHSALTPIFLAAHKEYNGIKYEQWDKSDKFIRFAVGFRLYDSIQKWKDVPLSEELHAIARRNALMTRNGKQTPASAWPFHNIKLDSSTVLKPTDMFRHIWLQTWIANVELRNEYMILDVNNWDNMPEAYDAIFKPNIEIVPREVKEVDSPW